MIRVSISHFNTLEAISRTSWLALSHDLAELNLVLKDTVKLKLSNLTNPASSFFPKSYIVSMSPTMSTLKPACFFILQTVVSVIKHSPFHISRSMIILLPIGSPITSCFFDKNDRQLSTSSILVTLQVCRYKIGSPPIEVSGLILLQDCIFWKFLYFISMNLGGHTNLLQCWNIKCL